MRIKAIGLVGVILLLAASQQATAAVVLPFTPYTDAGTTQPGEILQLPLRLPRTGESTAIPIAPAVAHYQASVVPAPAPGLLQHAFVFGQDMLEANTQQSLIVQVIARDPERKGTVDLTELEQHRELYQLRIFIDLNGDGTYAPDEQALLDLSAAEPNLSPEQMLQTTPRGRAMLIPPASTSMTLPREMIGDLQAARLRISFPALLRPDPNGGCGTGMGTVWRDPAVVPFTPQLDLILPVVAELPGENSGGLWLALWFRNGQSELHGYHRIAAGPRSDEMPRRTARLANDAFECNKRWWRIAAVDATLSTITLASLSSDAELPATGLLGGKLPEWTRLDLNTRAMFTQQDLQGKHILLVLQEGSHPQMYDAIRVLAQRIREPEGKGGAPIEILFVVDHFAPEQYFPATAGYSTLPYRLLLDKDVLDARASRGLRDLLDHGRGPLVILTDVKGKVILREESELYPLLPRLQRMLSGSDGKEQRP